MLTPNLSRTTGPVTPVSSLVVRDDLSFIELLKVQARLPSLLNDSSADFTEEDDILRVYADAAYDRVEELTGLVLLPATFTLLLPEVGCYIELPNGPADAITSFSYYDEDNDPILWASTNFQLENPTSSWQADLQVVSLNEQLPTTFANRMYPISLVYTAGCGENFSDLPSAAVAAIVQLGTFWFRNREAFDQRQYLPDDHPWWGLIDMLRKTGFN